MNGLKKTLWIAGFSLLGCSLNVSAFELYQGEVVLLGASPNAPVNPVKDSIQVVPPEEEVREYETPISPSELDARSGEVVLDSGLSERMDSLNPPNRHSELSILPQNNEVQFLDSAEREALLALLSHLQQADALIQRAQAYQRPDQRIKFRYDWLRQDIYKINRSMLDHLNSPENQTRFFEPLNDDYRR